MEPHPLLAALARLLGDFLGHADNDAPLIDTLLNHCARALVQGQDPASMRTTFEFERIQYFTTQYLTTEARAMLLERLIQVEQGLPPGGPPESRVFLREIPDRASWLPKSIPGWAVSAELAESVGPLLNRDGRRFWLDVYKTPGIIRELRFQVAERPSIILGPEAPLAVSFQPVNLPFRVVSKVEMGEGTVWVQAKRLVPSADEQQYCGLRVTSATLNFPGFAWPELSGAQAQGGSLMVHDVNIKASLTLHLAPAPANEGLGPYGADARSAEVQLPASIRLQFNQNVSTLDTVTGNVAWNLYGDQKTGAWTGQPASYNGLFSAVSIPLALDSQDFAVGQRQSPVFGLAGSTTLLATAWLLPAVPLSVPLRAAGAGLLSAKTTDGLTATCAGWLDANRAATAQIQLNECFLTAAPGQIRLMALSAATENAVQRLRLWPGEAGRWNDLTLRYADHFPLIYQCQAAGGESLAASATGEGQLDRPVGADGQPFALKTKDVFCLRAFSEPTDQVLIFDENMLADQAVAIAGIGTAFQSQAIALNNALLTVSPIHAFLLSGQLAPLAETFSDASLLCSFALLGYLPTLPDPYAANTGIFQSVDQQQALHNGLFPLGAIQRGLVGALRWKAAEVPSVQFIFGDKEAAFNNLSLHLNPILNLGLATERQSQTRSSRAGQAAARVRRRTGREVDNNEDHHYDLHLQVNDRFQHYRFFSLLDVSTAADWMGVDLGIIDEGFFFERSFELHPDQNPLSAEGMDVVASARFVRLFTVPQISWEPVINTTPPFNNENDPPGGLLTFNNDGPPTLLGNTGRHAVPIAPLPLAFYLDAQYRADQDFKAWSFFTLPFGMLGIARYNQEVPGMAKPTGATIGIVQHQFEGGTRTALQISTVGYLHDQGNRNFEGVTEQLSNLHDAQGNPIILQAPNGDPRGQASILARTVTDIFNNEFGAGGNNGQLRQRGVPVERYDFSGYGANIFSHWLNPKAVIGETSQAKFDVWRGRTAHEVVQVRSIIYPWCIHVVRTITMFRNSAGLVYRVDSGWRAESDGVYDFKALVDIMMPFFNLFMVEVPAYEFHPGVVQGVYDVRNIVETSDLLPYTTPWNKTTGYYIDPNDGKSKSVGAGKNLFIELVPVYFDADVQMDDVVSGGANGRVPSKRMLGYLQKSPAGIVISPEHFRELLLLQNGLGGPVDCLVNVGGSKQHMRMSRVEVQPSRDAANKLVFVVAAKGTPVLPKDGSWSVVQHQKATKTVSPISDNVVPLLRQGRLGQPNNNPFELAAPADLFTANLEDRATQYAFLQNTDTQKVLFRNPWFVRDSTTLQSSPPDLADAYQLLNSKGIFPKVENLQRLDLNNFALNISDVGYKLQHMLEPEKALEQELTKSPLYFINEKEVKVYVEYAKRDKNGNNVKDAGGNDIGKGFVNYNLDSTARQWANKLDGVTMYVDLLDMKRLFLIRGKLDTEKGKTPAFTGPELEFGKDLQPVYDILQVLLLLNGKDYAGALTKGLKIAMSNSPNNWEYKFQADKEIPVLRFPPPAADSPLAPLRLECFLKIGCYFNVGLPSGDGLPVPSGGAFVEFGAKLSVMCVSLAAATVYAVGTCTLRIGADTVRGPGLYLKLGFGIELVVGLPVIGNVSVYFAAGVEISVDKRIILVGAFILFRGRAELIGGLVTIQIQIEASGKVMRDAVADRTDCVAQVTFSLDISIFLIINIRFSKSFQENRQIA